MDSSPDTDHIRALHPDWEVVTALCDEVDRLRSVMAEVVELSDRRDMPMPSDKTAALWRIVRDYRADEPEGCQKPVTKIDGQWAVCALPHRHDGPHQLYRADRIRAALDELTHHGDLTPAGRTKLEQILGGE